jgi:hypothetical protein
MLDRLPGHSLLIVGMYFIGAMVLLGTSVSGLFVG